MTTAEIISIIFSSISLSISVPVGISELIKNKREKPIVKCNIDFERSAYIEPVYTNLGNECSILTSLTLINNSSSSIEISSMNLEFEENKWNCLSDSRIINANYLFRNIDCTVEINPKNTGLSFPFRMEPFSSKSGIVIFPYATLKDIPILLNVVTPFSTTTEAIYIRKSILPI